jgi:hypothetical protein
MGKKTAQAMDLPLETAPNTGDRQSLVRRDEIIRYLTEGHVTNVQVKETYADDGMTVVGHDVSFSTVTPSKQNRLDAMREQEAPPATDELVAEELPAEEPQPLPRAASSNVIVRVALDQKKALRDKYPEEFLKTLDI